VNSLNARELVAFFAIYVIWGSTYLAIRHAVETIPPLLTAGVRHLAAGLVLYVLYAGIRRVHLSATEWRASLIVAALFFLLGHGTLHWAEQTVPSGIAALLVATEPLWIAMLMPAVPGSRRRLRTAGGLLAGLAGVGLLVPRESLTAGSGQLWGSSAILIGAMSWAVGVRYAATAPLPRDPFVRAATTLLCGAALLLTASMVTGEMGRVDVRAISGRSLLGLGYLIVFGSVVAFSAYTWLLERRSATLVATHTFVNPAIAVLLGWLVAGEVLTPRIVWATCLILVAVVLLKSDSRRTPVNGRPTDGEHTPGPEAVRTWPGGPNATANL
jgi:drug/metabolite transporter (DMT)-like permease